MHCSDKILVAICREISLRTIDPSFNTHYARKWLAICSLHEWFFYLFIYFFFFLQTNCPGALLELIEEVYNLALSGRGAPGELGLAVELHRVREELENAKDQQKQTQEELKRRGEALLDVTSKLSVREAELRGVKEERDRARDDMEHSQLTKDEILTQAYEVRDQAVSRKNRVEVELAKTRIDVLQANSQLMEAIQQKIELSQQLEQWQMDMQSLLDEHVRSKLMPVASSIAATNSENSEIVAPARKKRSTGSSKKMFGLF